MQIVLAAIKSLPLTTKLGSDAVVAPIPYTVHNSLDFALVAVVELDVMCDCHWVLPQREPKRTPSAGNRARLKTGQRWI